MTPTTAAPASPGTMSPSVTASPCDQVLQQAGLAPHCPPGYRDFLDGSAAFHQMCASAPRPVFPVQVLGCRNQATSEWRFADPRQLLDMCAALNRQDPNWNVASCYGCCFGDYSVATPSGPSVASTVAVGDPVLTGSFVAGTLRWMPAPVAFSAGLEPPAEGSAAVTLALGEGSTARTLTLDPAQVVMLADRTLIPASQVAAGAALLGEDGQPVAVTGARRTTIRRAIQQISASTDFTGSLDGHLLSAAGVVIADYVLQLHFPGLPPAMKAPASPVTVSASAPAATPGAAPLAGRPGPTSGYTSSVALFPAGTVSLFTDDQATALQEALTVAPLSDRATLPSAQAAMRLVAGFYPDVIVDIAWERQEPNLWAFSLYGRDYVILSGALARTSGMHFEGLVMALAHGIARLQPQEGAAPACTAQADHDAFGPMSRNLWFGDAWMSQVMRALAQFTTLFNALGAGGTAAPAPAADPCTSPAIGCRLQTIQSAVAGGTLPDCASPR